MTECIEILEDVVRHMDIDSTDKRYRESGEIKAAKEEVVNRFQPIFSYDNIKNLSSDDYLSFLQFDNNKHWTGLPRNGNRAANDMQTLRTKLQILVDERLPLAERFDVANEISGIGKGIITAILQVVFPDDCGVWNNRIKGSMEAFNLWPAFPVGISPGEQYVILNEQLKKIAKELGIDLWTLDSLWWVISEKGIKPISISEVSDEEKAYSEGKAIFRMHKCYERNNALVQQKKQIAIDAGELICCICKFDFQERYGEIGEGFIECHHTTPVSEYTSKTTTTLQDLALVCSNCHRMLHRGNPLKTVEQLAEIVRHN